MKTKGLNSPLALINMYDKGKEDSLVCDKFPQGSAELLSLLGAYLKWYRSTNSTGDFSKLNSLFNYEVLSTFDPTKVDGTTSKFDQIDQRVISTGSTGQGLNVRLSDYPKFTGKSHDWPKFYKKFSAVATLNNLASLLDEDVEHEKKFKEDAAYHAKCVTFYSILKVVCQDGLASPQVELYDKEQDGYLAWRNLNNNNHHDGNIETYSSNVLTELLGLYLAYNTPGGIDRYLGRFEALELELKNSDPLTERQKVTFLLNGIKDKSYDTIKTLARSENYSYAKCLVELRQRGRDLSKQRATSTRFTNTVQSTTGKKASTEPKDYNNYWLPPNIWNSMSSRQKKAYREGLKAQGISMKQFTPKEPPKYSEAQGVPRRMEKATSTNDKPKDTKTDKPKEPDKGGDIWKLVGPQKRVAKMMRKAERARKPRKKDIKENVIESQGYGMQTSSYATQPRPGNDYFERPIPRKPARNVTGDIITVKPTTDGKVTRGTHSKTILPKCNINDHMVVASILNHMKDPNYYVDPNEIENKGLPKINMPGTFKTAKPEQTARPFKKIKLAGPVYLYDEDSKVAQLVFTIIERDEETKKETKRSLPYQTITEEYPELLRRYLKLNPACVDHYDIYQLEWTEKHGLLYQEPPVDFNTKEENMSAEENLSNEVQETDPEDWIIMYSSDEELSLDKKPKAKIHTNICVSTTSRKANSATTTNEEQDDILVDGGADTSGIGGACWIIEAQTEHKVDLEGFRPEHRLTDIPVVSAVTATDLPNGTTVLLRVNEAPYLGENATSILSSNQVRAHGGIVQDVPKRYGGLPHINIEGMIISVHLKNGLMVI